MSGERLFLDTTFIQALLNHRDQYHQRASGLLPRLRAADGIWVTEAVLIEVANALSAMDRKAAVGFIDRCYSEQGRPGGNLIVIPMNLGLFARGFQIYRSHADKDWGLTDCISFVVMRDHGLLDAITADRHFVQAGFRALMLESA